MFGISQKLSVFFRPKTRLGRIVRRFVVVGAVGSLVALASVALSAHLVAAAAEGRTFDRVADVPKRKVALVLGCSPKLLDGRRNLFFAKRIAAAAELFHAGRVEYLLVSGGNHRAGYDEPTEMRAALVEAGVPTERIVSDFAGFRTLDSIVRAREVFSESSFVVVSQRFHNERSIYIAADKGIDVVGYNAADVTSRGGLRTHLREALARVKTVLDCAVFETHPKFLGPKIAIGVASGK